MQRQLSSWPAVVRGCSEEDIWADGLAGLQDRAGLPGTPLTQEQHKQSRKHAVASSFAGKFSEGARKDY